MKYSKGDKVQFAEEKTKYTVRACNDRYLICTRSYNPKKTVIYCIVDLVDDIRSTNDYVFNPYDYVLDVDCEKSLTDLIAGEYKLSRRKSLQLNIMS